MTKQLLQQIMALYEKSSASEMEVTTKDLTIKLKRQNNSSTTNINEIVTTDSQLEISDEKMETETIKIKSPLVGVYYEAKAPGEAPFVKIGDRVQKGQILAIVEAMKIMNHITATDDGIVTAIHVNNGDIIEFDQVIVELTTEG